MSDWRQIQARIRKARTSPDPPGQLAALYERTHDAMVAFELAQIHEKAGTMVDAIQWYTAAAERFRRAQWKQKAEEALTRLGAPIPVTPAPTVSAKNETMESALPLEPMTTETAEDFSGNAFPEEPRSPEITIAAVTSEFEPVQASNPALNTSGPGEVTPIRAAEGPAGHPSGPRRKRRGRRGGRGRNKGLRPGAAISTAPTSLPVAPSVYERSAEPQAVPAIHVQPSPEFSARRSQESVAPASFEPPSIAGASLQMRVRAGDPALSSRMVKLESQLRRLLACSPHSVDQPDDAPAGPGVFLITDTDQTCYYYIESCQTLRVGIGNLLRSGRSSREGANLKEKLADHLGINEARVTKYLKDNCAVRWLQLDEGAAFLFHFAIAVLRPIANE